MCRLIFFDRPLKFCLRRIKFVEVLIIIIIFGFIYALKNNKLWNVTIVAVVAGVAVIKSCPSLL